MPKRRTYPTLSLHMHCLDEGVRNWSAFSLDAHKSSLVASPAIMDLDREHERAIWLNAYNAALTGLLARGISQAIATQLPNIVQIIGEECVFYATQAVKDAKAQGPD